MNLVTDFYSKPSQIGIYSVYNKSIKQQKGSGHLSRFIQSRRNNEKGLYKLLKFISGIHDLGLYAYKRFQNPKK